MTEEVMIVNHAFEPSDLTIPAGTDVVFRNESNEVHTVTAEDSSFDSGDIAPGDSYHFTFDSPGDCNIYCELHPEMKLHIFVE